MDVPSSSTTLLMPRLRLFRRSPSPRTLDDGPEATAEPAPSSARSRFSTTHDEEDEFPTPRMPLKPIASLTADPTPSSFPAHANNTPVPAETPAARLRALLAREPRSPRNTTPVPPPAPSSEADSAVGPARFGSSTSSVTRDSLKGIFSRALREPGDTPQKGRLRRNSFDGSSMEITPVADRHRGKRGPARRSLSDEEAEKPKSNRQPDPSFPLSTSVTFDILRARLTSSKSQLMNQNLPEVLHDHTSLASTTTSIAKHHRASTSLPQFNPTHATPSVNNLTPHPSFQMSSQLAFQSNLLEQDSEMQRVMGDVINSENEASTLALNVAQSTAIPSGSRPSSSLKGAENGSKLGSGRTGYELDSSSSFVNGRTDGERRSQEEVRNQWREREWNRPRLPSRSSTPEVHRRHSQEFHRLSQELRSPSPARPLSHESAMPQGIVAGPVHTQTSLISLRGLDGDHSSRSSSIGSQADYREQITELEREKNHEREREWNKRHSLSRPSSSLSTSSNQSFSHSHTHPLRSPSAMAYLTPTHASLQRKSSRTSLRSDSPASLSSSHESLKEWEQGEKKETAHERERNWNSPHPHWSTSKSPSTSHLKTWDKDNDSFRVTPSLIHQGDSNRHRGTSRTSTKLQSTLPKAESSATSPALLPESGDCSDPGLDESTVSTSQSPPPNSFNPSPGAASKFGWNLAPSPLPPLELDDPPDRRRSTSSPTPRPRPSSRASEAIISSQIPVRSRLKSSSSVGHATSDMSLTHVVGDESSFQRDHQDGLISFVGPRSRREIPRVKHSWSQEIIILASDEESIIGPSSQSTTPKSNPPNIVREIETDTETEVLMSPSPQGSPRLGALASIPNEASLQRLSDPPASTEPQLPTSETSSPFALVTGVRQTSFDSSILDFRTPSPPHDLPDLPGPPSSSDDDALGGTPIKDRRLDDNSNFTLTKTPKPPGAWAATPLPPKLGHRSSYSTAFFPLESTPPTSTSTPLPRANSLPPTHTETGTDSPGEDKLLTPAGSLSRARSSSLRTPLPPGAWMATPGQSALPSNGVDQSQYGSLGRRKGLLKVRFDVAESETSATEGHRPDSPVSTLRLGNPELPSPKLTTNRRTDSNIEVVVNGVPQPTSTPTVSHGTASPERSTTPTSREDGPSSQSLRKSPAVRLVDAYGRKRIDEDRPAEPLIDLLNGHADAERKTITSPPTPRRSLVRIVDAMGREVDDAMKTLDASDARTNRSLEADVSVILDDIPVGRAEALARMRKALRDLAESLSDTDRSEDLELNSSHLEQLEDVSKAARLARNQLAHNLQETVKRHDLYHNSKFSTWTRSLLPTTKKSTTIIYCGVIIQFLFFFAMWRYVHAEAHCLFYTTYYDPLYPEFTPIQESSCFSGTLSTSSRPWTMFDSYETIRREEWWSVWKEILRVIRHIGDQVWERWGEHAHFEKPT